MPSCRTVYAVSRGEYSDYAVLCLFETEELAKAYLAAHRRAEQSRGWPDWAEHGRVEPFQLWAALPLVEVETYEEPEYAYRDRSGRVSPRSFAGAERVIVAMNKETRVIERDPETLALRASR